MSPDPQGLWQQKKRLWREFYRLTLAQAAALEPAEADKLLGLLQQRGRCMAALQVVEEQLQALAASDQGDDPGELSPEGRLQGAACADAGSAGGLADTAGNMAAGDVKAEVQELMTRCWQVDNENRQRLAASYAGLQREWAGFQAGKEAVLSYRGGRRSGRGCFVDAKR